MAAEERESFVFEARPTQVRWLVFVLIGLASWLLYLHRYAWGVIKPAFRKENPDLTDTEIGWLDSAFLATYAPGQIPGGLAGDLLGARAVLALSVLGWSLTLAALAGVLGFWLLFGVRAAFGLGQAGAYPAISQVTRRWFPPGVRTSVQGAVTALGRVGGACAPPLIAAFLMAGLGLSWQTALLVIALPGLLLALAFLVLFRNSPRQHPWTNEAEQEVIEADPSRKGEQGASATRESSLRSPTLPARQEETAITEEALRSLTLPARQDPVPRLSLRLTGPAGLSLAMLLVYSFFSTFADMLYVNWIPTFLVEGKGLTLAEMGWFAPLPLLGGAAGGLVGGALNDVLLRRTGRPRWVRSGIACVGKSLAAVLLLASLAVPDGRWVMVLLLACKFFGDWSLSTQWGAITDMAGKNSATLFGVVNAVGSLGGFVAGPLLGQFKQRYGWDGLFLSVVAAYGAAALAWLFIDCTRRLGGAETDRTIA
jgi:sugar phosphate permease